MTWYFYFSFSVEQFKMMERTKIYILQPRQATELMVGINANLKQYRIKLFGCCMEELLVGNLTRTSGILCCSIKLRWILRIFFF